MPTGHLWYVKRGSVVKGPFPITMMERNAVLGRLRATDLVSNDGEVWDRVDQTPALADALAENSRRAENRRFDERQGERRAPPSAGKPVEASQRSEEDRRRDESPEIRKRRERSRRVWKSIREDRIDSRLALAGIGLALAVIAVLALVLERPGNTGAPDCESPPRAGVNWDFCQKPGVNLKQLDVRGMSARNSRLFGADLAGASMADANLAYADLGNAVATLADLSRARLVGASFRGADLSYANLQDADLRFVDFANADLNGADLRNARLGSAIWPDGRSCARQSVGACLSQ